ncbi:MAG: CBS domain-containing protein [Solirubrobacterales bacterium]|nr:CBS domain-containing protein [Solirubrobacterales bacterium]
MSPESVVNEVLRRDVPLLRAGDTVEQALRTLLGTDLPALPVVDADGRLLGVFGEREFLGALFPGYLGELKGAAFVPAVLDDALERRLTCAREPVERHITTDHVDVPVSAGDAQVAETFLHHRVLIVPIVDGGRVIGVVRRSDFFRALARRLLERAGA